MLYRRQTKNLRGFFSRRNVIVIIFAIIILFFIIRKPVSVIRTFQSVSLSVYSAKQNLFGGIQNIFSLAANKENLAEDNRRLIEQKNTYELYASTTIASLNQTILDLQNSLGRKNVSVKNAIGTAFVIGKPPIVPYGTIVVDLGGKAGVKIGDLALVGNYIIGNISDVSDNRSTIKLYGDKDESVPLLVGDKRLPVTGLGAGLGAYKAKLAGVGSEIVGQDVRMISKSDYIFGKVVSIGQSGGEQYEDITIQSPVNVFEIGTVDIVSQ